MILARVAPRLVLLLLGTAGSLQAATFLIGGGPGVAWLDSRTRDEVQGWPRFGYNLTAQIETLLSPDLYLVTGVSLESKGERYELLAPDLTENWDEGRISLTYLQVPVLWKFSSAGPGLRVSALAGAEVGFLVAKRLDLDGARVHDEEFSKWRSPDIGVAWGAQLDLPPAPGGPALFVRAGGYYGLVDGVDGFTNPFWKSEDHSSRNVNLKLTAGVRFGSGAAPAAPAKPAPRAPAAPGAPDDAAPAEAPPPRPTREVLER